jgi:lipoprotein-anchoring transpeptidase ErfK/SrfK
MSLTRRDFLKLSGLSVAAFSLPAFPQVWDDPERLPDGGFDPRPSGRVTRAREPLYAEPDLGSRRLERLERDSLLELDEAFLSPYGPDHNPRWYRASGGFVHSAYIQRIDSPHLNTSLIEPPPPSGLLGEVTVPFTRAIYKTRAGSWMPLYRLYYGSLHWITGLETSSEGEPLYRLTNERLRVTYRVPAAHLQPLISSEFAPLSPEVDGKRVEVSLKDQTMQAYEGSHLVRTAPVSTGRRWMETPTGEFQVERKYPSRHMGDGGLTGDIRAYELVGVPWATFFHSAGIAFHGTWWHDNFGQPMSQGCVNLRNEDALWLFRWTSPTYSGYAQGERPAYLTSEKSGTPVIVYS